MDWTEVFYIADHRDIYAELPWGKTITEDRAYSVNIRPNSYFSHAKHYQMNSCTTYEACLALIQKYVTEFGSAGNFMDTCMGMSDGFRVESKPELERRSEYYDSYYEDISMCDDDIREAIGEGKDTRVISGDNVSATVTNVTKEEGQRTLVDLSGPFVEWVRDVLFTTILEFDGHTKQELLDALDGEVDIYCFNELLHGLKVHGVKSIRRLKELSMADLALYLCDTVNTWALE